MDVPNYKVLRCGHICIKYTTQCPSYSDDSLQCKPGRFMFHFQGSKRITKVLCNLQCVPLQVSLYKAHLPTCTSQCLQWPFTIAWHSIQQYTGNISIAKGSIPCGTKCYTGNVLMFITCWRILYNNSSCLLPDSDKLTQCFALYVLCIYHWLGVAWSLYLPYSMYLIGRFQSKLQTMHSTCIVTIHKSTHLHSMIL